MSNGYQRLTDGHDDVRTIFGQTAEKQKLWYSMCSDNFLRASVAEGCLAEFLI